ncbi:FadR family transcriptional regulator [Sporolactobacillus sp. THM7-4]|nr:FadR family transcriptional regulator [Sporolactobacillus sp. THM7-4]
MAFKTIKKKNLYEQIISQIVRYIQNERLKPGDRLPSENELSEYFQVSKTAVREALTVLASRGILEKKPGIGSIIKEMDGETIIDRLTNHLIMNRHTLKEILEFRRGIEVEASALAAQNASNEQIEGLKQANQDLIKVNESGGVGVEEDYHFHYLIIQASRNSLYKRIYDIISPYFHEAMNITKQQSKKISTRYFKEAHEEHRMIIQSIENKDSKQARIYTIKHLNNNEEKLWKNKLEI